MNLNYIWVYSHENGRIKKVGTYKSRKRAIEKAREFIGDSVTVSITREDDRFASKVFVGEYGSKDHGTLG